MSKELKVLASFCDFMLLVIRQPDILATQADTPSLLSCPKTYYQLHQNSPKRDHQGTGSGLQGE